MNLKVLLAVSLVLNVVLVAVVGLRKSPEPEKHPNSAAAQAPAQPAKSGRPQFTRAAQSFDWRNVESSDYRQYIENLRSIGCPEETIRDIIIADVNKLFEARKREATKSIDDFQYWKTGAQLFATPDPAKLQEDIKRSAELAAEKRALLKDLLGIDVPERPENPFFQANPMDRMLGFLSPEKRIALMELEQKLAAKRLAPGAAAPPGDFAGIRKLQEEKEAALAEILTPEELEEYHLRVSPTAMNLRMQLEGFDPTEQEFRQIFQVKKQFDEEFGPAAFASNSDPAAAEKRAAAQAEMEEQVREILGDERYMEYQRAQDWAYKGALQVARQNGLSEDVAAQIYELKRLAEEQARGFRTDQTLTVEQQLEAMALIRAEAEKGVKELLGEKGFESYQRQAGGAWMRSLHPGYSQ